MTHAINAPCGNATQGLIHILEHLKLNQGQRIPKPLKTRFERLLSASEAGRDHAATILARQINWLHHLDPDWVMSEITPWFDFEHELSEPAWNGLLSSVRVPAKEIFVAIKRHLLELFPQVYQWQWEPGLARVAVQIMVELAIYRPDEPHGLNAKEVRLCLRNMNDLNRKDAVDQLRRIGQKNDANWSSHVIPFINNVWPREREFRTSTLVTSWLRLLDDTADNFPAVLSAVRRFLVPITEKRHGLYRFYHAVNDEQSLTERHSEAVLELLDAIVANSIENIPHELAQILDLLEEADPSRVQDRRFLRLIGLIEQT